jgi:cobalamin biosynthesis protein CobD/CbiB
MLALIVAIVLEATVESTIGYLHPVVELHHLVGIY